MVEPPRASASRYSRFVRVMRFVLPLTAMGLIGVVVLWPQLRGLETGFIMPDIRDVELEEDGRVRLDRPEYVGRGSDGAPYRVVAGTARVDPASPRRIELEAMRADFPRPGARNVAVEAETALYDRDAGTLDLDGGIRVTTSDGYELRTRAATVDVGRGDVRSKGAVDGDGPRGAIVADRLAIQNGGDVLRFEGNVRATLNMGRAEP